MHDNRLFAPANSVNQLRLLLRLYWEAKGEKCLIDLEFLIPLNQDESDVFEAAHYLKERGLIVIEASNRCGLGARWYLGLTDQGIVKVKRLGQSDPKQIKCVTKNYYNKCVFHNSVNDSSITTQNFGAKTAEVLLLIEKLRKTFQSIASQGQGKAVKVVDALDKEIKKEHPRRDKLRSLLGQLGVMAGKPAVETLVSEITKLIFGELGPR